MSRPPRLVTTHIRVMTPSTGIIHFKPGELLTVHDVDETVYRVSSEKHGPVNVAVWKMRACTRAVKVVNRLL